MRNDESHVIYQGIPADIWWREADERRRRERWLRIRNAVLFVLAFFLAGVGIAAAVVWWAVS